MIGQNPSVSKSNVLQSFNFFSLSMGSSKLMGIFPKVVNFNEWFSPFIGQKMMLLNRRWVIAELGMGVLVFRC